MANGNPRKLKIHRSRTRVQEAFNKLTLTPFDATTNLTSSQLDYKENHVMFPTLTGAIAIAIDDTDNSFAGDRVFMYLTADGTNRVVTLSTNITAISTVTVPANKTVVLTLSFNGTAYVLENNFSLTQATFATINSYLLSTVITAFATGGQASAVALTSEYNEITVCATAGDSVKLDTAAAGKVQWVKNNGVAPLDVFPSTGDSINALSANAAIRLPVGALVMFVAVDGTVWETNDQMLSTLGGVVMRVEPGTANTGVTALTFGDGKNFVTTLTFSGLAVGSVTAVNLAIGVLLYTLPAGVQVIDYAYMNVALAGSGSAVDADTPDMGIGTVIGSGAVAVLGGTGTFEDIITGQTVNDVNGTAEVKTALPTAGVPLIRESGDAKTIHLNVADGWAGSANIAATGTVVIKWTKLA
jgi:hypothetical protein